jgi:hypothetical protein
LHPLELNAVIELDDVDAIQIAEEVEMPPRAPEFAVGRDLQASGGFFLNKRRDLGVLERAQRVVVDLPWGMERPGRGLG